MTLRKSDSQVQERLDPVDDIVVIGTGFIGLPLALQLAAHGKHVIGVDIDENLVAAINDQSLNLDENQLQELLEQDEIESNLEARTEPTGGDAFVISVPTPLSVPQKSPDLSHIHEAIESIIPHLTDGDLVTIESTIPPLTCENVIIPRLADSGFVPGEEIHLAHAPERILPGNVLEEIVHNDRVIGGINQPSAQRASKIYEPFLEGDVFYTDLLSAELCKLMENTYRDVNVALANEFALICDEVDEIRASEVIKLANKHPRVDILRPSIGVGGHCLPVDPWFLNEVDPEHTNLITTARRINDMMPRVASRKIRRVLSSYADPTIITLGLTYKPETYDTRNSPAREIIEELRLDGYEVHAYDRFVEGADYSALETLCEKVDPDVLIQLVPHDETVEDLHTIPTDKDFEAFRFEGHDLVAVSND